MATNKRRMTEDIAIFYNRLKQRNEYLTKRRAVFSTPDGSRDPRLPTPSDGVQAPVLHEKATTVREAPLRCTPYDDSLLEMFTMDPGRPRFLMLFDTA